MMFRLMIRAGYWAIGGRNIVACRGNRICQKATDTTGLSRRTEKLIYPSAYHLKTVLPGVRMICAKASMSDFGIIVAKMRFTAERCIGCGACVKACASPRRGCLSLKTEKPQRKSRFVSDAANVFWHVPPSPGSISHRSSGRSVWAEEPVKNATGREKFSRNPLQRDVIRQVIPTCSNLKKKCWEVKPVYLHIGNISLIRGYLR